MARVDNDNPVPRDVDNPLDKTKPQLFAQLMLDTNDVFVLKKKSLDSFPPAYQIKLRNTYRFYGIRYFSDENFIPRMSPSTFELI